LVPPLVFGNGSAMDSTPPQRHRPGQRSGQARKVQPESGATAQPESEEDLDSASLALKRQPALFLVPDGWGRLHEVEDTSETALARRLEENRAQHVAMQLEASVGRSTTWDNLVKPDLWTYGARVLPKKIITGEIFRMMREVKGPRASDLALPAEDPEMTWEEAHDLASDIVIWALKSFKGVLLEDWRPDGGASFRTYFVGKCCHGFAAVYRKWLRQRARQMGRENVDELQDDKVPAARDRPEQAAIIRLQIDHYLEGCDDDLELAITVLDGLEYPNRMIAELLCKTEKVVEYRIDKNRQRAKDRWGRGDEEAIRRNRGEVA
jgi:DNA-directed RNA polymerase specialized sigma24 family protein